MGTTKEIAYDFKKVELARLIKAIAHPARIAILEHLLEIDQCVCGDIVNELNLAQATVSQHLKEMKEAGIIQGTIEGRNVCYCIDPEKYKGLREKLTLLLKPYQKEQHCC